MPEDIRNSEARRQ